MQEAGGSVVVLDDLTSGDPERIPDAPLVVGSVLDEALVRRTLQENSVHGVVHVAAKKQVAESVRRPLYYYRENVEGLRVLLEAVIDEGLQSFVFSSSAAVYGEPRTPIVDEQSDCRPVNPYGSTKLVGERMVAEAAAASGLRYANLRYFNVAGAGSPRLADRGASNLVPMVFQRLSERLPPLIFGDDYDTPDGTCIRDFVHVADIASAHVAAARALDEGRTAALTANIGRGDGVSVRDMIDLIRVVSGTADQPWAEPVVEPRRPGDPPRVVASADTLRAALGWRASYTVEDMVRSAWDGWQARAAGPATA
jgi:UDP-glucose 4-epimerase